MYTIKIYNRERMLINTVICGSCKPTEPVVTKVLENNVSIGAYTARVHKAVIC